MGSTTTLLKITNFYDPKPIIIIPTKNNYDLMDQWHQRQTEPKKPKLIKDIEKTEGIKNNIYMDKYIRNAFSDKEYDIWQKYLFKYNFYNQNRLKFNGFKKIALDTFESNDLRIHFLDDYIEITCFTDDNYFQYKGKILTYDKFINIMNIMNINITEI